MIDHSEGTEMSRISKITYLPVDENIDEPEIDYNPCRALTNEEVDALIKKAREKSTHAYRMAQLVKQMKTQRQGKNKKKKKR
jgi:hypothetical protein